MISSALELEDGGIGGLVWDGKDEIWLKVKWNERRDATPPLHSTINTGSRTRYCAASPAKGGRAFGRLVNLYVQRNRRYVKVGTMCSNCGAHWINGKARADHSAQTGAILAILWQA